jgi:hypothetical protein
MKCCWRSRVDRRATSFKKEAHGASFLSLMGTGDITFDEDSRVFLVEYFCELYPREIQYL